LLLGKPTVKKQEQCINLKKDNDKIEIKGVNDMAEIKFEIKQTIGILSESPKGWKKELNLVSWNDKDPKYDIREWSPDHSKMGKGVTFTKEELKALKVLLTAIEF